MATKDCPGSVCVSLRMNYESPGRDNYEKPFDKQFLSDILSQVWCGPCFDKLNVYKPREKQTPDEVKTAPAPTTEEILIQLLESLGFMREH